MTTASALPRVATLGCLFGLGAEARSEADHPVMSGGQGPTGANGSSELRFFWSAHKGYRSNPESPTKKKGFGATWRFQCAHLLVSGGGFFFFCWGGGQGCTMKKRWKRHTHTHLD